MTPNQITLIRIFLIPVMVFFYLADFIPYGKAIAVFVFAIAALTDFIDGKLARKTGQVTDTGKFLDTLADKILIMAGILLVVADQTIIAPIGAIVGILILAREFIVTGLRQIAVIKNVVIAADKWGKYKALFQDLSIPAFMLLAFFIQYNILTGVALDVFTYICYGLLAIAVLLTIISCINYFVKNKDILKSKEDKNGR